MWYTIYLDYKIDKSLSSFLTTTTQLKNEVKSQQSLYERKVSWQQEHISIIIVIRK